MGIEILNLQEIECPTSRDTYGAVFNLGHHVYDGGKWVRRLVEPHPMVKGLQIIVDEPSYR